MDRLVTFLNLCSFSRKLLVAVEEKWDNNVLAINKVAADNWKVGYVTYAFMFLLAGHKSDRTIKFGILSSMNPHNHVLPPVPTP